MSVSHGILPPGLGTPINPIRLPFNVAKYHIKKTDDEKDFVLGNAIVTDRYISTICMLTDVVPLCDDPNTFRVTLNDGTHELQQSDISKPHFSPAVWARLCDCTRVKASTNKPYNRNKYQTSIYYPIMVEFVSKLQLDVYAYPVLGWESCELFDLDALTDTQPGRNSEEWYNIIRQHNIEKSIAFYEEYCLTPQQKLSLNGQHQLLSYHRILDNPCCPIPMTIDNTQWDIKPKPLLQQEKSTLLYYGRNIANRLVHLIVRLSRHGECKDNSITPITPDTNELIDHPAKNSTLYFLYRLNLHFEFNHWNMATGSTMVSSFVVGEEGCKNQKLIDKHEKKANQIVQEMTIIDKQTKEYCALLRKEYNKHIQQVRYLYSTITSRLSSHPLFVTFIEPLQKQLEDAMGVAKVNLQQQFDTIDEVNDLLNWNNTTSDLISQCKQIIDTLLNTNIALYNDFYDYYLPHLEEQLQSLQRQMQFNLISSPPRTNCTLYPSSSPSSPPSQHTFSSHKIDVDSKFNQNDSHDPDDDDDYFGFYDSGKKTMLADQRLCVEGHIQPIPPSSITTTTSSAISQFTYQHDVIRPVAQYRRRAHVIPPSSSLSLLHDAGVFHSLTLSSLHACNIDNNDKTNKNNNSHQPQESALHIHSRAQQDTLQLSSARQNLWLNALVDAQDGQITKLKKQIQNLQDSNSLYESHIKIYQQQLESNDKQLDAKASQLEFKDKQLELLHQRLEFLHQHYATQLEAKDKQRELELEAKDRELALLRQLLDNSNQK